MHWSRGFFRLWIIGSVAYIGLAIWFIGIDDFEGFWRPRAKYVVTSPTGILREFDSSLPEETVRSAAMNLAREDARARGIAEQSASGAKDVKENTTRILNYIADSNGRQRSTAWRALALVLLPPFIVFGVGFVLRWIGRGFTRTN
jgi:hypothetical protein